ncbi:hypothetical protein AB0D54_31315 [Streptomyces xanthophaeus]|uniref:hypothetical protein n=1 Tax=Streptomyces xanthophaeus TaxID=67385 RepID=UPI003428458D
MNRPEGSLTSQPRSTSRLALARAPSTFVFAAPSTPSPVASSLHVNGTAASPRTVTARCYSGDSTETGSPCRHDGTTDPGTGTASSTRSASSGRTSTR